MKKIMWQKYEDALEQQISSPFIKNIISSSIEEDSKTKESESDDLIFYKDAIEKEIKIEISESLIGEVSMISLFDCWVGHTNFNLTTDIVKQLNKSEGVEVLKICSRYRFFIGLGKMFDFKNVRRNIEKTLIGENR